MMHISASTAPIRVKQKPLYPQLNAECDKHYYNSLFKRLGNPPESLNGVEVGCTNNAVQHPHFECLQISCKIKLAILIKVKKVYIQMS